MIRHFGLRFCRNSSVDSLLRLDIGENLWFSPSTKMKRNRLDSPSHVSDRSLSPKIFLSPTALTMSSTVRIHAVVSIGMVNTLKQRAHRATLNTSAVMSLRPQLRCKLALCPHCLDPLYVGRTLRDKGSSGQT